MRYGVFASTILVLALGVVASLVAQDVNLQRGKYLVEEVGRCQECHTLKLASGDFDRSKWLKGGPLAVAPVAQIAGWHAAAPDITSTSALWQRWGDDGMAKFLETAINPRGGKAGPPMPAYHIAHDDAVAIAAYLKSLP